MLGIVAVSAVMIVLALCTQLFDTPVEAAEKQMAALADDYYVEYLYPRTLGDLERDPSEALAEYAEVGIPTTYLRQLLHYDENHAEAEKALTAIKCDTNVTGVRYFPVEPYGPHDYRAQYFWACEGKSQD